MMSHNDKPLENPSQLQPSDDVKEAVNRLEELNEVVDGSNLKTNSSKKSAANQTKEDSKDTHHSELDEDAYSYHDFHHHDHHHIDDAEADLGLNLSLEGEINSPINKIWHHLTKNDLLEKWQPSLRINRLESGGSISVFQDGREREVMLMDVEPNQILSFVWGDDSIQYEFEEAGSKTLFELTYWFADSELAEGAIVMPWLLLLSELENYLSNEDAHNKDQNWIQELNDEINIIIAEKQSKKID